MKGLLLQQDGSLLGVDFTMQIAVSWLLSIAILTALFMKAIIAYRRANMRNGMEPRKGRKYSKS